MLQRACDSRGCCCLLTCTLLVVLLFACVSPVYAMRLKYACSVAAVVGGGVVLRPSVCGATGTRRRWSRLHAAMALCRACM